MNPLKKTLLYSSIAFCISLLSYHMLGHIGSMFLFFIFFAALFSSVFCTVVGSLKSLSLWRFKTSSKGAKMEVIDSMYKAGSMCIDLDRYNYRFIPAAAFNPSGLEDLPPKSSKTDSMVYPSHLSDDDKVCLANDAGSNMKSVREIEIPFIVCKWPKDYKTPKAVRREIAEEEFEAGLNAAYMITDGKQGKPSKFLN